MIKLSSNLCINENNAALSLYEGDLPKLSENILKCYRLNLFQEIVISINHGPQLTIESPASLSDGLLI